MASHRSPELDPVVLICTIITVALLFWVGWTQVRPALAVASLHCPAPDHAIWAPGIGQAVCGESFTAGVKSR